MSHAEAENVRGIRVVVESIRVLPLAKVSQRKVRTRFFMRQPELFTGLGGQRTNDRYILHQLWRNAVTLL